MAFLLRLAPQKISIHALREEGDLCFFLADDEDDISIHALREEGDPAVEHQKQVLNKFLSTPSARRATHREGVSVMERDISIHALREEGDGSHRKQSIIGGIFLSTPSARRAT